MIAHQFWSQEAEQSVLGSLLLEDIAWDKVEDLLEARFFVLEQNSILFETIKHLATHGVPRDAVTVAERLKETGLLDKIGGIVYIGDLIHSTPSAYNVRAYAEIVRDKFRLRMLAKATGHIDSILEDPDLKTSEKAEKAADIILSSMDDTAGELAYVSGPTAIQEAYDWIEARQTQPERLLGLSTGFHDLDKAILGLQEGMLYLVGARPSMGKSAFMLMLASACLDQGSPVFIHSMEMPRGQCIRRMIAARAGIAYDHLQRRLSEQEWERLSAFLARDRNQPIYIDDTPALTIDNLYYRAKRGIRLYGKGPVFVDYLQLMSVANKQSRAVEIGDISKGLKQLAKDLGVPVIALSQLNRSVEMRPNKRPVMSDLRDSGQLEQDADVVLMLYRDSVYNQFSQLAQAHIVELLIRKNRDNPLAEVRLLDNLRLQRFENAKQDVYNIGDD